MKREQFVNNAATTLNGALTAVATSVTVTDGTVFPADGDYRLMVDNEIMLVTARATHVLTVVRGIEGTIAVSHLTLADIKAVLTEGAFTKYFADAIGVSPGFSGGDISKRAPFRLQDINGVTLDSTDFTWFNQSTDSLVDDSTGGITVTSNDNVTSEYKILYRTAPATPYSVTVCMQFGAGCAHRAAGSVFCCGWKDSVDDDLMQLVLESGGLDGRFWYFSSVTATGSVATTNISRKTFAYSDRMWMRISDDGTLIHAEASPDGINYQLIGQDERTGQITPDQVFWGYHIRGPVDKHYHLLSWVEGPVVEPDGYEFLIPTLATYNTNSGTTQDFASTIGTPAAMLSHMVFGTAIDTIYTDTGRSLTTNDVAANAEMTIGARQQNNAGASEARTYHNTLYSLGVPDPTGTLGPDSRADVSISSGQVRMTWDSSGASGDFVGHNLFFGGAKLQAWQTNTAFSVGVGLTTAVSGLGFQPNALIHIGGGDTGSATNARLNFGQSMGFASKDGTQGSVGFIAEDAADPSVNDSFIDDTHCITTLNGTLAKQQELTSWDADGGTFTTRTNSMTGTEAVLWLQLADDADSTVQVIDFAASTGDQTFTFGFRPRLVILAFAHGTAEDSIQNLDGGFTTSFITADRQSCSSTFVEHNATDSNVESLLSEKALKITDGIGGTLWEADFSSFTATEMILNFTTVDVASKALVMAIR